MTRPRKRNPRIAVRNAARLPMNARRQHVQMTVIMRCVPFRDMDRFMNKWIGEPFTDLLGYDPFASLSRRARVMSNGLNSMLSGNQARVYDNEDGSADVIMDMPGVNKDDIHVSYPSAYAIRVNRSRHEHDERHNEYSEYTEIIPIHAGLDVTAATAKLENGQLRIHVPVKAAGDEPDNTISID